MIDTNHPKISQRRQCELLEISRSGLYYQPVLISEETLALMNAIDEEYTRHPFRGSRGMTDHLQKQGFDVGRYRVRQLYEKMGIHSVAPGPHTSKPNTQHPIFPYLLKNLAITHSHQVLSTDITYIRLSRGFIYLMAIIDWYSRFVLDWEISITLEADFCIEAVDRILRPGICDIFNTDQGAQFTTPRFTQPLIDNNIAVSMDGKGRAIDNVFIERLWRSLKYECVYLRQFESVQQAKDSISEYFNFYNYERGHQSLDYQTPYQVHCESLVKQKKEHLLKELTKHEYYNLQDLQLTPKPSNGIITNVNKEGLITQR
jgi:putative transposase